jgi:general stress protein CsbA
LSSTALIFGRSFFPLFAVAIILGVIVWGPWISLAVTVVAIAAALRLL